MEVDTEAAEQAIRAFLRALGRDPEVGELRDTPGRVVEAFGQDLLAGYAVDVVELLQNGSVPYDGETGGAVVVKDISATTVCPHHLLPGVGHATVAYAPGERILGLGTIAKLVDAHARRLVLQEQIGDDVCRSLVEHAGARAAYCRLSLVHSCLASRGARQTEATVVTVATTGTFKTPEGQHTLTLALGPEAL